MPAFQNILVLLRTLVVEKHPNTLDCLFSQKTPKCFQVYVFKERNHHSAHQDVLYDFKSWETLQSDYFSMLVKVSFTRFGPRQE